MLGVHVVSKGAYTAVCFCIILSASFLLTAPESALAEERGKAVIVFIDRVSLDDIIEAEMPNLDHLISFGGIGLMTTNTGGSRSQRDAYLTMGASARAIGSEKSILSLNATEKYHDTLASDLYRCITGGTCQDTAVVNLGIPQIIRNNESKPHTVKIGALGTALRDAGLIPAVIGNCDTPSELKRYLPGFLMDDRGIVPLGYVDSDYLEHDPLRPFGIKTNYEILIERTEDLWDKCDVLAIQLGDTSRAEDFRYEASDKMNKAYKRLALEEGDAFLGRLLDKLNLDTDMIIVLSALNPASDLSENNRLSPVIIAGRGFCKGLLSSASTKRKGIVTNMDIGPTVLGFFGMDKLAVQNGSPIAALPDSGTLEDLFRFNKRLVEIYNQRGFLLRSYVLAQIVVMIGALLIILYNRRYIGLVYAGVFFLLCIPVSYLLLPLFHRPELAGSFILSWLLSAVLTVVLYFFRTNTIKKIMVISIATAGSIILDQLAGGPLIKGSPLGYDAISGARFYGIGNEYMGILLGAVCAGCGAMLESGDRTLHRAAILLPLLTLTVMGYPSYGANVGGTVSAGLAFASLYVLARKGRISLRHVLPIGLFAGAAVTLIFFIDSVRAVDSQSHLGQTISLIQANGIYELFNIVYRKVSMNIKLFKYTIWTRVFLLSLISMVILLFRPIGIVKNTAKQYPMAIKGLTAGIIGSIAALLTNDSGIVAAATTMVFTAPPFILLVCDCLRAEQQDRILAA
mgnify:CR=1 FL=1